MTSANRDVPRQTRWIQLRNSMIATCAMALLAAMWVGNNLSALMHTPLTENVAPLTAVTSLACGCMAVSLASLAMAGVAQYRAERIGASLSAEDGPAPP